MYNLVLGLTLLFVAQIVVWFATNIQFLSKWCNDNPFLVSVMFGTISSYLFILGTKYSALYFQNQIWPIRILSFCMGVISFTFLTSYFLNENIETKTIVCLILTAIIMCIQVFYK